MTGILTVAEVCQRYGIVLPKQIGGFHDGQARRDPASAHTFTRKSPATEENLLEVVECSAAAVDAAVSGRPPRRRRNHLAATGTR